jgi:glycosyltransferase involved in cell wall biosynthesis
MAARSGSPASSPWPRPVTVAIDVGPLYGQRTGVGTAVSGLLEALSGRPDVVLDPYVVSFRSDPQPGHRRLPVPGGVASHLWSRSDRPSARRWLATADVVHGTNYVVPPSSLPSVVSVYDCWFLRHPELATPVVRRAGKRLRRAVAAGAHVHACSTHTADQVRMLLATDRVSTILLGAPPAPPALDQLAGVALAPALAGVPFVLAIGTEERRKNLPMLIAAFGQVAGDHPDLHLVLTGAPGDDSGAVDAAIATVSPSAASRIRRLGFVDEASKHWLLRSATVLAYPSLDEGFGFPVLEAQQAGTPVVASRVGSLPEVAGDGALLVEHAGHAADPEPFAEAIARVLDDGALRLGLLAAGLRNAAHFDWERTADRLADLYHQLAGGGA